MKLRLFLFLLFLTSQSCWAQRLDLAFTAGATGLGIDVSMPVDEHWRVRTGFSPMSFRLGTKHDGSTYCTRPVTLGFDLGLAHWGGTPHVVMHDGVDLTHDMQELIKGRHFRELVNFIGSLKAQPVFDVRIAVPLF